MSREAQLVKAVEELIEPLLEDMSVELVDIEWRREYGGRVLRFLVDQQGGINLDQISKVSEVVGHALDQTEVIKEPYNLEVSSPGVERPLKRPADFHRFTGKKISVKTFQPIDNRRNFVGMLESADDSGIRVKAEDGKFDLSYESIAKAHLVFEWKSTGK